MRSGTIGPSIHLNLQDPEQTVICTPIQYRQSMVRPGSDFSYYFNPPQRSARARWHERYGLCRGGPRAVRVYGEGR